MRLIFKQSFRAPTYGETGFTLVELMAAMLLLSLILLAATGWIASWGKGSVNTSNMLQQEMSAQTLFQTLRQDFHTAVSVSETGKELLFTNTDHQQIRYYLSDSKNLIRAVNGRGASVIAVNVSRWQTKIVGITGIEAAVALEKEGHLWSGSEVITLRGEALPHVQNKASAENNL
jgi:prepilin-type N-terminal cleavage/methylation domain-containing protein